MENEIETSAVTFLSGLVLGAVIGAGIALLAAPDSGRRTRKRLRRVAGDARETAADRFEDLAEEVKGRVDDALEGARRRLAK